MLITGKKANIPKWWNSDSWRLKKHFPCYHIKEVRPSFYLAGETAVAEMKNYEKLDALSVLSRCY